MASQIPAPVDANKILTGSWAIGKPSTSVVDPIITNTNNTNKENATRGRGGGGGRMRGGRGAAATTTTSSSDSSSSSSTDTEKHGPSRARYSAIKGGGRGRGGRGGKENINTSNTNNNDNNNNSKDEAASEQGKENNENGSDEHAATANSDEKKERKPRREWKPVDPCTEPDEALFKSALTAIDNGIKSCNEKIRSYTQQIEDAASARKGHSSNRKPLIERLKTIQKEKQQAWEELSLYKSQLTQIDESMTAQKTKLSSQRKELKYTSVEELDDAILDIEHRLQVNSFSITQEKRLVDEVRQLKRQRDAVIVYIVDQHHADANKVDTSDLKTKKNAAKTLYVNFKEEEKKIQNELDTAKASDSEVNTDINLQLQARNKAKEDREKFNEKRETLRSNYYKQQKQHKLWCLYSEHLKRKEATQAKYDAVKKERELKKAAYLREKARREREHEAWLARKEERKAQQEAWEMQKAIEREEREAAEAAKDPYEQHKIICDELVKYCQTLIPKDETSESSSSSSDTSSTSVLAAERANTFKGAKVSVFVPKKDEDTLFASGGLKNKKTAKFEKAKKQASVRVVSLTHVPDIFHAFAKIAISPPLTQNDVSATVEKLKDRKEYYNSAPLPEMKKSKKNEKLNDDEEDPEPQLLPDHDAVDDEEHVNVNANANVNEEEEAEIAAEEQAEREANISIAAAALDEEKARRVQEEIEYQKHQEQDRKKQVEIVDDAVNEEKQRRIDENNRETQNDEDERKKRQSSAKLAVDEEQNRRIQEIVDDDKKIENERNDARNKIVNETENERERRIVDSVNEDDVMKSTRRRMSIDAAAAANAKNTKSTE